jgi:RNA polymerase sigma factor (sigma-70 family)
MPQQITREPLSPQSQTDSEIGDRQLLERFLARHDEAAFAHLVQRHGRMVWGVCRGILRHEQDTEDAFQAVFLTLTRNAASIRKTDAVGCWLYGVAGRIARKASRKTVCRQQHERQASTAAAPPPPWSEAAWRELQSMLNEEVQRLPEKLRIPFVLCCLQGLSKSEAARELEWKEGTVSGRLAQARKLLHSRLTRRGVSLAAVLTGLALEQQAVLGAPAALVQGTVQAVLAQAPGGVAAATLSPGAIALAESAPVLAAAKLKVAGLAAAALLLAAGAGVVTYPLFHPGEGENVPREQAIAPPPVLEQPVDARVFVAAFSPDGSRLVTAGAMRALPGQLVLWQIPEGRELFRIRALAGIRTAVFSPDGNTLVTGDYDGNIALRDARTGAIRTSIHGHDLGVNSVAFSPDGKALLSAGLDRLVKLWDADLIKKPLTFAGHTDMIYGAAFFRDGERFVTGSKDGTVKIWNVHDGKEKLTLLGHKGPVEAVAVTPDGKVVASGSYDGSIRLWDAETGQQTAFLQDRPLAPPAAAAPGDKKMPAGGGGGGAGVSGEVLAYNPLVLALAFSHDGKQLVSAGGDGVLRLWDVGRRELRAVIGGHAAEVWSVAFSPDDRYVASGSFDTTARLWEVKERQLVATLSTGPSSPIPGPPDLLTPRIKKGPKLAGDLDPAFGPVWRDRPQAAVVELLEDNADFFLENLDNNGGSDASVAAREERTHFSGTCSLSVTSFQRYRTQMPRWLYRIAENPRPGEFRYLRFAWKRTEAPGIMLQLQAHPRKWLRYYAGDVSPTVQAWGPMIRVAEQPPRGWEMVTRDLFQDYGRAVIIGIGLSALEGDGQAFFDHIYLGRTIEDLDGVTESKRNVVDPAEDFVDGLRTWVWAGVVIGGVLLVVATVLLLRKERRRARQRQTEQPNPSRGAVVT